MTDPVEVLARMEGFVGSEAAMDLARHWIAALEAAGFKLISREPTEAMLMAAGYRGAMDSRYMKSWMETHDWPLMWDAAPTYGGKP